VEATKVVEEATKVVEATKEVTKVVVAKVVEEDMEDTAVCELTLLNFQKSDLHSGGGGGGY
jgi:hypothetical protein